MSDILNKILAVKRDEVAAARAVKSLAALREEAQAQPAPGGPLPRSGPRGIFLPR